MHVKRLNVFLFYYSEFVLYIGLLLMCLRIKQKYEKLITANNYSLNLAS